MNTEDEKKTTNVLGGYGYEGRSSFSDRLIVLKGEMSESAFAQKCKMPLSSMRKYFSGSLPSIDKAVQIAMENGVSISWLATGQEDASYIREITRNYGLDEKFLEEFALIPGYRVQVSAGHGALVQGEMEPCRHLAFRRKWLKWRGFAEKDLAVVWSKGDSMEPTIGNNDTLVVHLGRTRPVDGHIYVVRNDDQLWVKRLQVLPHAWLLISDNPLYKEIEVQKDEQHTFEVIGQVVHIAHDVGE